MENRSDRATWPPLEQDFARVGSFVQEEDGSITPELDPKTSKEEDPLSLS